MKETFAGKIRAAAKELSQGGSSFTYMELSVKACLKTRKDEKRMSNTIRDFIKAGEAQRVVPGLGIFVYLGKQKKDLPLKDQMRNYLKIKGFVTVDELQELGATRSYAMEWLQMLVCRGVLEDRGNSRYELIADMPIPENDDKADRLRTLRAKKKREALREVDKAQAHLDKARRAIELISDYAGTR